MLLGCSTEEEPVSESTTTETESSTEETSEELETSNPAETRITALKGPTAMGMVSFMNQVDSGESFDNDFQFNMVGAVDEIPAGIAKGDIDIAAVPANLASVLYNNTEGQVQVLAINTLGVIYITENGNSITSVEDLRGKTIYASGKGATPEYALNYILSSNGIDPAADVTIEWKAEHAECLAALTANENAIAMLPQPFVTTGQLQNENIRVALDLTEEWDKLQEGSDAPSTMITGVVIARKAFIEEHPSAVSEFLDVYKSSVEFTNTNLEEAAKLIGSYEIVPENVALKAIPECNITFVDGNDMKTQLSGYLNVLMEQNPASIGGKLPADDFYYSK